MPGLSSNWCLNKGLITGACKALTSVRLDNFGTHVSSWLLPGFYHVHGSGVFLLSVTHVCSPGLRVTECMMESYILPKNVSDA